MIKKEIVDLIGSTNDKNQTAFRFANVYFTLRGYVVLSPIIFKNELTLLKQVYSGVISEKEIDKTLYDLCSKKLKMSDIICIVDEKYIGESTLNRIKQALSMNKKIVVYDIMTNSIKNYVPNNIK
jgi:hypothetical protein